MKARLVLDQGADPSKATAEQREKIRFVPSKDKRKKVVPIYPKGTIFEGEQAIFLCKTGQAAPADEECRLAVGMTEAESERQQEEYLMDSLGINDRDDRELFKAGVIKGYRGANHEYIPGPNWESYQQALAESELLDDDDEIEGADSDSDSDE